MHPFFCITAQFNIALTQNTMYKQMYINTKHNVHPIGPWYNFWITKWITQLSTAPHHFHFTSESFVNQPQGREDEHWHLETQFVSSVIKKFM